MAICRRPNDGDGAHQPPDAAVEWVLLLTMLLFWAGSFLFNRIAVRELPVFSIVVGRIVIATIILLLALRFRGESLPCDPAVWLVFLVIGLLKNELPFSLTVWCQVRISSGQASILNAMTPILTVIMAHLLTRDEKMTPSRVAGILVGFAGVEVILSAKIRAGSGIMLAAQCALLGATICYVVLMRNLVGLALIIAGLLVTDGRIRLPLRD